MLCSLALFGPQMMIDVACSNLSEASREVESSNSQTAAPVVKTENECIAISQPRPAAPAEDDPSKADSKAFSTSPPLDYMLLLGEDVTLDNFASAEPPSSTDFAPEFDLTDPTFWDLDLANCNPELAMPTDDNIW